MPDKIRPIADTDMLVVDDVTGAVKGIAPGGDQDKGATFGGGSASVAVQSVRSSFAIAGDSRLAYGAPTAGTGESTGYRSNSQLMWMNDHLASLGRVGLDLIGMHAQGGETLTTSEATGRWAAFLASPAEVGALMFMHNDMNPAGVVDDTVEAFLEKYEAKIVQALSTKKVLLVCSGTPLVSSVSTSYSNTWYRFKAVNTGLRRICAKYAPRTIYIDQYSAILNQSSGTLDAITGTIQDDVGDGVHQTTKGAQMLGHSAADQIADKLVISRYRTKGSNILPAWTGTGGSKSGTFTCTTQANLPANWEIFLSSGGGAASSVTISAVDGGIRRLVFDNTGTASDATFHIRIDATARAAATAALAIGDLVQAAFGFELFGNVGCNLGGYIRLNSNNAYVNFHGGKSSNEDVLVVPSVGVGGIRMGSPMSIPVSPTNMEFLIEVVVPGTTGVCTLDIWNPELYKLTA